MFKNAALVVTSQKNYPLPIIFSMELNDVEKCSLCGMTIETASKIDSPTGSLKLSSKWPWYAVIYLIKSESVSLKCGGTLIQSKAVVTAGR